MIGNGNLKKYMTLKVGVYGFKLLTKRKLIICMISFGLFPHSSIGEAEHGSTEIV